jgi:FAD dependent monooxygenase
MGMGVDGMRRLGYQSGICERRNFLQAIFDQLKDKSKVNLKKKVTNIKHGDDVTVKCEDGSEFRGDVVIGANGIHSRTRKEMQKYADKTGPPGLMNKDKNSEFNHPDF